MKILIVGGGMVGAFLAKVLSEKNEVTLVESDPARFNHLSDTLKGVRLVNEDGCEPWVLEYAGIQGSDIVLAVTGDDEDNLVVSYLSKFEYDIPRVIARVVNPKNRWLFNKDFGVDVEVCTSDIIATIVEEETTLGEVITVMKLQSGDIGLVEITVPSDSKAVNRSLSELELPPETLIVTVVRDDAMRIPTADTVLRTGDKVLAITSVKNRDALESLLGHGS
ncbi:MAG: TrkA family potassium uptake protein [Actinobacteria bacterium]|nr:TrkA family potassium uptake protein [Actinomycetota bacterium]